MRKENYEKLNGVCTHDFPYLGSDDDRLFYTKKMNILLENYCEKYGYIFFNFYDHYCDDEGFLSYEISDKICHIQNNTKILNPFWEFNINLEIY